ncbi:MAG TPA: tetratricopeptide repeat protein [Coleofasciculaceae cyanobacterium]|jgi:tetratricopeptide (TPR) repeat protein
MRISSNNDFTHTGFGANQPGRPAMNVQFSMLRFAAQANDTFEKNTDGGSPAGAVEETPDWSVQLKALGTEIRQQVSEGRFDEAKRLLLEQLKLQKKHLGPDAMETAYTLDFLGNASKELTEDNQALEYYTAALKVCQKNPGPESNSLTIEIMEFLGEIFRDRGDLASAEAEYAGALQMALDETVEKNFDPSVSTITLGLLDVLVNEKNPRQKEVDMLNEDPQTWLHSRVPPSTVH